MSGAGLLAGKKILVTGVLSETSIAFSIAKVAQEQGADLVLTSFGRAMSLTKRSAARLPAAPRQYPEDLAAPDMVVDPEEQHVVLPHDRGLVADSASPH